MTAHITSLLWDRSPSLKLRVMTTTNTSILLNYIHFSKWLLNCSFKIWLGIPLAFKCLSLSFEAHVKWSSSFLPLPKNQCKEESIFCSREQLLGWGLPITRHETNLFKLKNGCLYVISPPFSWMHCGWVSPEKWLTNSLWFFVIRRATVSARPQQHCIIPLLY